MRIYVASSTKNKNQPHVVEQLRREGYDVYDFNNPTLYDGDPCSDHRSACLKSDYCSLRTRGNQLYKTHLDAILGCDALILLFPCGKQAHLEAGFAAGIKKRVFALFGSMEDRETMHGLIEYESTEVKDLIAKLRIVADGIEARNEEYQREEKQRLADQENDE